MSRQSFAEIRDWKGSDTTNIRYIFFKITHMLHTIVMSFNDGVYHFRISSQQWITWVGTAGLRSGWKDNHCAAGKRVKSPLFKLTLPGSNFMYPQIARTSIATGPTASWSVVTVRLGGRQFLQDWCSQLEDYCELVTEISIVLFESFCACVYLKWTFFFAYV